MDFGALVCVPRNPDCLNCVFSKDCTAFNEGRVAMLPVKSKSLNKKTRWFTYYILCDPDHLVIEQRYGRDIWQGLYQFPMVESSFADAKDNAIHVREDGPPTEDPLLKKALKATRLLPAGGIFRQVLSHQRIRARFIIALVDDIGRIAMKEGWRAIKRSELDEYAYPRIIRTFLQENRDLLQDSHRSSARE